MKIDRNQALMEMIKIIDKQISIAQTLSIEEIVLLLRMTKLTLQMHAHAISDDELRTFCAALQSGAMHFPWSQDQKRKDVLPPMSQTSVVLGMDRNLPRAMQARVNALFRAQDLRNPRKRRRAAVVPAVAHAASPPREPH